MATKCLTPEEALVAFWKSYKGEKAALARAIGVTPQAVNGWSRVPAERVLAVSGVTGVPTHTLRPDLYHAPESAP